MILGFFENIWSAILGETVIFPTIFSFKCIIRRIIRDKKSTSASDSKKSWGKKIPFSGEKFFWRKQLYKLLYINERGAIHALSNRKNILFVFLGNVGKKDVHEWKRKTFIFVSCMKFFFFDKMWLVYGIH